MKVVLAPPMLHLEVSSSTTSTSSALLLSQLSLLGMKESGIGREGKVIMIVFIIAYNIIIAIITIITGSSIGLDEYLEVKYVCMGGL